MSTSSQLDEPSIFHDKAFINGQWTAAKSGNRFEVIDPGTGKPFASCPTCDAQDVDAAVRASRLAFEKFKLVNPRTRAKILYDWHNLITKHRADIARVVTYETGKPLAEAEGEMTYALGFTWWFAGEAERTAGTLSQAAAPGRRVFTLKQPIGVCVALVPWNFPVAMILRKVSAALAAGCTMIIKPSPETPLSVLMLVDLAVKAGLDPGVLSVLTTDLNKTPELSEALCKHPSVNKVTFTGSTAVGKLVARHCSEGLKKVTLELGGNCPFLIFDDADLEQALTALMTLKWRHAGQACITANRVYVQSGVFKKFENMLVDATKKLKVGHGAEEGTTMGPVTTPRGLDKTMAQIEDAKKHGGQVVLGGRKPEKLTGYFFEPTVLTDMKPEVRAFPPYLVTVLLWSKYCPNDLEISRI